MAKDSLLYPTLAERIEELIAAHRLLLDGAREAARVAGFALQVVHVDSDPASSHALA